MLPQSFWCAAWSAATRSVVSLGHSSHHWLVPGASAAWVLSLARCVGHRGLAVPALVLASGVSHLKSVVAVARATWGMPTGSSVTHIRQGGHRQRALILLTAVWVRHCPPEPAVLSGSQHLVTGHLVMVALSLASNTSTDRICIKCAGSTLGWKYF